MELNRCAVCLLQAEGVGHIVLHIIHRACTSCYSRACITHRCSWYVFIDGTAPHRAVCESDLCLRSKYNRIYKGRLSNFPDITLCNKKLDWALSKTYFIWGIQHYQIKKMSHKARFKFCSIIVLPVLLVLHNKHKHIALYPTIKVK